MMESYLRAYIHFWMTVLSLIKLMVLSIKINFPLRASHAN